MVLGDRRVLGKIRIEFATGENHGGNLFETGPSFVAAACSANSKSHDQLRHLRFGDDHLCLIRSFCALLRHVNQRIGGGHPWKTFLASVSWTRRMSAQKRDKERDTSTLAPLFSHEAWANRLLHTSRESVRSENCSRIYYPVLSLGPVFEPIMSLVASVPQKDGLSSKTTRPPLSQIELAVYMPAKHLSPQSIT